ncbi:MAG: flagellar hook-associated protein FlgK [Rubellimicrobium sp.]|nr:flagellar hook-associated protein FlgK [Rubellimicrobium sp.]
MSLSHSLANALSGLTAASRMAETVSANLANVMTDGYGRRSVELAAQARGLNGGGVRVEGIVRHVDRSVLSDRRDAGAGLEGRRLTVDSLTRVEAAIGIAGSDTTLSSRLSALDSSLTAAGADPSSDIALGRVVTRLGELATHLRSVAAIVQNERLDADRKVAADIDTLNRSLVALEGVNRDIAAALLSGADPSAFMDQRQRIIDTISAIVPVREIDRPAGGVALVTQGGEILIDGPARQYGFSGVNIVTPDMSLDSGGLSGITWNGRPAPGEPGIGRLDGGSLGAAMRLRDDVLPARAESLDRFAADLVLRFANPTTDPTLASGAAGLFTDAGMPFDPLALAGVTGLAGRIAVNDLVDPTRGGALWHLRDGLGAAVAGPVGNAAQIHAWADALTRTQPLTTGGPPGDAAAHAARIEAGVATDRLHAEERQAEASARWNALRETELSGGVDSDHEMQNLLRIEQAYAANARVLSTLDDMIRILMEI